MSTYVQLFYKKFMMKGNYFYDSSEWTLKRRKQRNQYKAESVLVHFPDFYNIWHSFRILICSINENPNDAMQVISRTLCSIKPPHDINF